MSIRIFRRDGAQAVLAHGEVNAEEALLLRRIVERHAKLLANPKLLLATVFRGETVR